MFALLVGNAEGARTRDMPSITLDGMLTGDWSTSSVDGIGSYEALLHGWRDVLLYVCVYR